MSITRVKLSGSTGGRGIAVTTGAPATLHTSTTAASTSDEVHIWYVNNTAASVTVVAYMGTTGTADQVNYVIPASDGLHLMVPGLFLFSGLIAYGSAGATGIIAYGFINRLTTA